MILSTVHTGVHATLPATAIVELGKGLAWLLNPSTWAEGTMPASGTVELEIVHATDATRSGRNDLVEFIYNDQPYLLAVWFTDDDDTSTFPIVKEGTSYGFKA